MFRSHSFSLLPPLARIDPRQIKASTSRLVRYWVTGRARTRVRKWLPGTIFFAAIVGLLLPGGAWATGSTIKWNRAGASSNWSTGANWVGGAAPGPNDTALFDGTSNSSSTIDVSTSVLSLNVTSASTATITAANGIK